MLRQLKYVFSILTLLALASTTASAQEGFVQQQEQEVQKLEISRQGDIEMNCGALSQEAILMRDIITTTQDIKDDTKMMSRGINAATGIGGFLIGSVTGGLGLAAAGFLLDQDTKSDSTQADTVQDLAKQRRSFMVGIFNAKGCNGPMEYALQDNLPEPAPVTTNKAVMSSAHAAAAIEPATGDDESWGQDTYPQQRYIQKRTGKARYNN